MDTHARLQIFFQRFNFDYVFLVDEWREDPKDHYMRAVIGSPAKRVSRFAGGPMVAQH